MWTRASIRTHFLFKDWRSFFFGCPRKFVQNISKQNKIPKVGFPWVSLSLERKQSLWCEHLPKLLKSIWAGWKRLGELLMQWNVAQAFVIAASIKGGRTTLPLTLKCFHENGNECYRALLPLNAQGSEVLKGCFHYTINRASHLLSFFLHPSSKAQGLGADSLGQPGRAVFSLPARAVNPTAVPRWAQQKSIPCRHSSCTFSSGRRQSPIWRAGAGCNV